MSFQSHQEKTATLFLADLPVKSGGRDIKFAVSHLL